LSFGVSQEPKNMTDLSAIQAILFDTEGVIYHRPRQDRYLRAFLEQHDLKPRHPSVLERALRAARFDVLTGRISVETYFDAVLRTHGVCDSQWLEEGRAALFQDAADIELYPGVIETLTRLQSAGLRLGAVVDSPYTAGEEIAWLAVRQLSPGVWSVFVVSSAVGVTKTEPLIFEQALSQLDLTPYAAAFVGHSSAEFACAASLGMQTIAFLPDDPAVETDYTISAIYGLEDLFLAR
jgi:FMN phosphatase YigB (HAD superfamily)